MASGYDISQSNAASSATGAIRFGNVNIGGKNVALGWIVGGVLVVISFGLWLYFRRNK